VLQLQDDVTSWVFLHSEAEAKDIRGGATGAEPKTPMVYETWIEGGFHKINVTLEFCFSQRELGPHIHGEWVKTYYSTSMK